MLVPDTEDSSQMAGDNNQMTIDGNQYAVLAEVEGERYYLDMVIAYSPKEAVKNVKRSGRAEDLMYQFSLNAEIENFIVLNVGRITVHRD